MDVLAEEVETEEEGDSREEEDVAIALMAVQRHMEVITVIRAITHMETIIIIIYLTPSWNNWSPNTVRYYQ